MENLKFAYTVYRTQLRMIFGGKHRYQKEYDHALDVLEERGHWSYLYKSLEGPKADQVCVALEKWIAAFQVKDTDDADMLEHRLRRELHVLIYGPKYREGRDGYLSD